MRVGPVDVESAVFKKLSQGMPVTSKSRNVAMASDVPFILPLSHVVSVSRTWYAGVWGVAYSSGREEG